MMKDDGNDDEEEEEKEVMSRNCRALLLSY